MPKVLVVEDVPDIRLLLVETLADAGFEVIQAGDGLAALQQASHERPDVVLLDVMMPGMDGFEVLAKLRQEPATRHIPVVMLTSLSALEGEKRGMDLGVAHYLTKPLDLGVLGATLRVILRDRAPGAASAADRPAGATAPQRSAVPAAPPLFTPGEKHSGADGGEKSAGDLGKRKQFIRTGDKLVALEQKLGGGLPLGSLTLVEGAVSSGKSVLCQHLVFGALADGFDAAYFTSEYSPARLDLQMKSLRLDVSDPSCSGRLHVFEIKEPEEDESPEPVLAELIRAMEVLPARTQFVVVDAITEMVRESSGDAVIAFFTACRSMCDRGKTAVVVIHSYAFASNVATFKRIHSAWDGHLSLWSETVGGKAVRTVEVRRLNSNAVESDNMVTVEVVPNLGMRVLSTARARG